MNFSDQIKELKEMHAEALTQQQQAVARIVDCFETQIMHIESDLDNDREDLELEKTLTVKLKGLLDGGLVELVGELVAKMEETCTSQCCGYSSKACMSTLGCDIDAVLTKAEESMP